MAAMPTPTSPGQSPCPSSSHERNKTYTQSQHDDPKVIFNKTIGGHYRHGTTGYRNVGALFLTWADDDMHCKESEVDKLMKTFKENFRFETESYEIPSERWATALHKRVADFCYMYDSPEDLAIIYYGGHGYPGTETNQLKLSARFENDGNGDPNVFFNDIRTCLRLPACDQLMILDCCFAAKAFHHEHVGRRKFELLTSAAHDAKSPAPKHKHSFTKSLNDAMTRLLKDNPKGFCTSHLYRKVYHAIPKVKPLLFDQARHNLGKIWLRPQVQSESRKIQDRQHLKLKLILNAEPKGAVMNELALSLQYLPYVEKVQFEELYAPGKQLIEFMRFVWQTQAIRPFIKRIRAKQKLRQISKLKGGDHPAGSQESLLKLQLGQNPQNACDWAGTIAENQDTSSSSEPPTASRVDKKATSTKARTEITPANFESDLAGYSEVASMPTPPPAKGLHNPLQSPQKGTLTGLRPKYLQYLNIHHSLMLQQILPQHLP